MNTPAKRGLSAKIGEARKGCRASRDAAYGLKKAGNSEGSLKAFTDQLEPSSKAYLGRIRQMVNSQREQLNATGAHIAELRSQTATPC